MVVTVASFVIVDNLVDVFVGIVVNFLVVVFWFLGQIMLNEVSLGKGLTSKIMIMNTSDITMVCFASMMMISTSVTVIVFGGAHWKDPVLPTFTAISAMMTVASTAPDGTRWMFRGACSPVVSHVII